MDKELIGLKELLYQLVFGGSTTILVGTFYIFIADELRRLYKKAGKGKEGINLIWYFASQVNLLDYIKLNENNIESFRQKYPILRPYYKTRKEFDDEFFERFKKEREISVEEIIGNYKNLEKILNNGINKL